MMAHDRIRAPSPAFGSSSCLVERPSLVSPSAQSSFMVVNPSTLTAHSESKTSTLSRANRPPHINTHGPTPSFSFHLSPNTGLSSPNRSQPSSPNRTPSRNPLPLVLNPHLVGLNAEDVIDNIFNPRPSTLPNPGPFHYYKPPEPINVGVGVGVNVNVNGNGNGAVRWAGGGAGEFGKVGEWSMSMAPVVRIDDMEGPGEGMERLGLNEKNGNGEEGGGVAPGWWKRLNGNGISRSNSPAPRGPSRNSRPSTAGS